MHKIFRNISNADHQDYKQWAYLYTDEAGRLQIIVRTHAEYGVIISGFEECSLENFEPGWRPFEPKAFDAPQE